MSGPGGPDEDRSDGFGYGGWQSEYWDEEGGQIMTDALSRPFDLLLGRRLFGAGTVPAGLRTAASTATGKGVVIATYEPAGPLVTGSFG